MRLVGKLLMAAAALLGLWTAAPAQTPSVIRYSYLNNGFAYTSTEREMVEGSQPFWCRLERIVFPGGSKAYKLEFDFVAPKSVNIPKGAGLSLQTTDGKIIRAEQMAAERTGKRSFQGAGGQATWWNRGQYLLEEEDLGKLAASGVKLMEVAYDWSPDGFWQIAFRGNELGKVLSRELAALKKEPVPEEEVGDQSYAQ